MLFTFCLMLFAWVSPRWALTTSALFGLYLSLGMYWANSYWGGSIAASGGALVMLGVGVYLARQTPWAGAIFAMGALLLFWTRPYEGGVSILVVLMVFARELWRKRRASAVVAAILVLVVGGSWTCYYDQAVTGNPFLLPYQLHDRQYNVTPVFWFLPLRPEPAYSHPRLASQHGVRGWEADEYRKDEGPWWHSLATSLIACLRTLEVPLIMTLLFTLLVPVAWRDPLYRKMATVTGVFLLALSIETFHMEHYFAPIWAAFALMIAVWAERAVSAERAYSLRLRKRPMGVALILLVLATPVADALVVQVLSLLQATPGPSATMAGANFIHADWSGRRAALIARLSALERRQLVIVRYPSPDWDVDEEWVYNGADLDRQRVVFAHDLGTEQNRALFNYYSDRTALLMTFDSASKQEHIEPYPVAQPQQRSSGSSNSNLSHPDQARLTTRRSRRSDGDGEPHEER